MIRAAVRGRTATTGSQAPNGRPSQIRATPVASRTAAAGRAGMRSPRASGLRRRTIQAAQRIRSLTVAEVGQLLDYEREHANRPAVGQTFQVRLSELAAGETPSGGSQSPSAGSPTGPAGTAPPAFPPPHGTPDQPARPKANRQVPEQAAS